MPNIQSQSTDSPAHVERWRSTQNPNSEVIARQMTAEGLRPYPWSNGPNFRYAPRRQNHGKVLYCVQGSLDVILPDYSQRITLRAGDRLDLASGIRHAQIVGPNGALCLESEANH